MLKHNLGRSLSTGAATFCYKFDVHKSSPSCSEQDSIEVHIKYHANWFMHFEVMESQISTVKRNGLIFRPSCTVHQWQTKSWTAGHLHIESNLKATFKICVFLLFVVCLKSVFLHIIIWFTWLKYASVRTSMHISRPGSLKTLLLN